MSLLLKQANIRCPEVPLLCAIALRLELSTASSQDVRFDRCLDICSSEERMRGLEVSATILIVAENPASSAIAICIAPQLQIEAR